MFSQANCKKGTKLNHNGRQFTGLFWIICLDQVENIGQENVTVCEIWYCQSHGPFYRVAEKKWSIMQHFHGKLCSKTGYYWQILNFVILSPEDKALISIQNQICGFLRSFDR